MATPPTILMRSLLKEAVKMSDYNFRQFALRRVKMGFVMNRNLQEEEAIAATKDGEEQLALLKRQVIIGNLYPSGQSVMD
mmetsp:Transcript_22421/g.21559  ORF Transcript_22421/g.21559 Transcript_22421/m.21559 type:complete len:80 (-) Transcript_22421:402-641(-)|eukprot:CAMPEP_0197832810 /NCGR_PEP_ID=MMETSP1437-20131217/16274_1 /TAXON_ID=49252 ORGANISM="Eucampia antarctica, Strain CCMP1452" /NCGR_SAMPLE_ID=MMETSP1437 /ASSEMBLY_ACC=CAM_ASM_001096 /LENGTH=79 /DNA_ID=CAMNT_0043436407 /DNA_START=72 /DNA_END=311 /DNA_ORIENTATION=+